MVVVSHLFPFYGKILPNYSHFNPRLREGGDVRFCEPYLTSSIFQSTPPRRRRPPCPASESLGLQYFNPRLREGGDGKLINAGLTLIQFQSTPPRRRRRQHIVIPQLSCTYLVSTTFLSAIFSFISQYVVLFFLF